MMMTVRPFSSYLENRSQFQVLRTGYRQKISVGGLGSAGLRWAQLLMIFNVYGTLGWDMVRNQTICLTLLFSAFIQIIRTIPSFPIRTSCLCTRVELERKIELPLVQMVP